MAASNAPKTQGNIIKVPTGQLAKSNGAFACIFARDVRPYANWDDRPLACAKDKPFPHVLVQQRWDYLLGFPGGQVDPGESLEDALIREAKEELNADLTVGELNLVCTHMREGGSFAAHLFAVEVSAERFNEIAEHSFQAHDALSESLGTIRLRVNMYDTGKGGCLVNYMRHTPMSFSVRHELMEVFDTLQLLTVDEMAYLRSQVPQGWFDSRANLLRTIERIDSLGEDERNKIREYLSMDWNGF